MEMTCREAMAAVNGELLLAGDPDKKINRVIIDSRDIGQDDLFVPLRGERTDGHRFLPDAAAKGAACSFASQAVELSSLQEMTVIGVSETLEALQRMAAAYRSRFTLPVVAVTGSVGKTTTKDMIAAVLSSRLKTLKTAGNLNNEIGLPVMLSRLDSTYGAAVLEMGMSGYGEIDLLAKLAAPTIGVITNIGESHLEMLGSREGIARAKSELLPRLPAEGTAVVNGDEPLLVPHLQGLACSVLTFGFSSAANLRCTDMYADTGGKKVRLEQEGYPPLVLAPPLPGRHNIYNLMAAVAAGRLLDLTDEEITAGLANIEMTGMRLEVVQTPAGIYVINDAYNASPTSMAAAIDVLAEKAVNAAKIAVFGDMLELGDMEEEGHRRVGRLVAEHGLDALLVLGERAQMIAAGALAAGYSGSLVHRCDSHSHAAQLVRELAQPGDWVLLKGSRGMRMEDVLAALSEG
ncbi:MAG: UDP-N-acetylmuramoyl-tripeptide--D-alanyl-D-alanine ligase [Bacillota bacterium]|nr:UDP-N-acetylmuramoyl-tripeptide--D-alanyl-D-alanine ligase [Bacillota bacterium]MDW7684020.1 UDP-N-acetylmuramoyl-tripeptide--D-alanyl-D-alanine ligase [Bacillota bacterium]